MHVCVHARAMSTYVDTYTSRAVETRARTDAYHPYIRVGVRTLSVRTYVSIPVRMYMNTYVARK